MVEKFGLSPKEEIKEVRSPFQFRSYKADLRFN